ncbi:MAG TPA: ATP-binding protein [Bacteroidota bacterium]|nr:ATP-binding protein [Bacteroidota bacterium]
MLKRIGFKLIIAVGITAIITIGVYSYFNIRSLRESLLGEVERHATQLSETVKNSTRYDMLLNRREHIHIIINDIGADPGIDEVRVLNKEGEIIYSSREESIGHMVDKRAESCYACHAADRPLEKLSIVERTRIFRIHPDSSRVMGVINPIYTERSCWDAACHAHPQGQTVLGVLDVTISLAEVDRLIQKSAFEVGIFAVSGVLTLSLIIGFFVNRWVNTPVNALLSATKQVGAGNLNYMIPDLGVDDLGMLAKSFNTMTQRLSEARLQLFQSDKMASLGRLAAGVAHEINNPLTGVLSYSTHLLKRAERDPEAQEDLQVIVRETLRSREIVKNLLDFARQSIPKKNPAAINSVVERAVGVVENQLMIRKITLVRNFSRELPTVVIDANQIQQVFINMLVNAADAIDEEGGTITISTSSQKLSPLGMRHIKSASCPNGHSLMFNQFKIAGFPSVRVKAKCDSAEGFIMLDPVYGKNRHHFDLTVEPRKELHMTCPECNTSLVRANDTCPECGALTYAFDVPATGIFVGCSRYGCKWQKWDIVDSEGEKEYVEISIADTGSGITQDDLPRIFEPFFTTKGQRGTGLGLSVIWGIVDNHDGTVSVESEVSKGSVFRVRLPVQHDRRLRLEMP